MTYSERFFERPIVEVLSLYDSVVSTDVSVGSLVVTDNELEPLYLQEH